MKTCLDISNSLFEKVKRLARARRTTIRALTEEGLRLVLKKNEGKAQISPKLLTFGGDGLTDEFKSSGLNWERLRDEVYRGHGS